MLKFNLQFFAEEKTEQATPKKKRDARKKGQVAQSKDIGAALSLIIVVITIHLTSKLIADQMMQIFMRVHEMMLNVDSLYNFKDLQTLFLEILYRGVMIVLPIFGVAMITSFAAAYLQVGYLFSLEVIKPKLEKISPISGFKRLFSIKSLVEMVKAIIKGVILVYICYDYLQDHLMEIVQSFDISLMQFLGLMWQFVLNVTIRCGLFLLLVAFGDLAFKRWQQAKDLRMTKQEIKDEYKQTEGDPMLKGKIREKQRQMAMSRMMQDVPDADVVITNPTHFAVAIKYNINDGVSPKVIAKGQNLIAQNIKKIATENDVTIVENKPLARALFASTEVGDFIPVELYQAVAEVLAYVYSLKEN